MELPPYYLPRPPANGDAETTDAFDRMFDETVARGDGAEIEYALPYPKWQFLCHLCDRRGLLTHGSGRADIAEFEPRQSNDVDEFGNRCAVYAASDALWAMYFAIVDRDRHIRSLVNACFSAITPDGQAGPFYFFSVNGDALPHTPWRNGTIYLLPGETFERQRPFFQNGAEIQSAQWASLVPVKPLAKLAVEPADFPFLAQIRGHDFAVIRERAQKNPNGFPWLEDTDA